MEGNSSITGGDASSPESEWRPCELCGKEVENPCPFGNVSDDCDCPAADAKRAEQAARVKQTHEDIERLGIEGFRKMVAGRTKAPAKAPATEFGRWVADNKAAQDAKVKAGQLSEYLVLLTEVEAMMGLSAAYVRSDGACIVPEGKISSIYGNPSSCKSWILLDIARAVAGRGGRCLWWDFEDTKESLLERCAAIGFGPEDGLGNIGFIPPVVADDPMLVKQAALWVKQGSGPGLVVIDALASAGCPSDGSDISPWWDTHVKPFGTDVTMALGDHIPKRSEDRAPGAIGSTHKRSFLTGVSLLVDGNPWTKTDDGRMRLVNQKDRHSVLPAGPNKAVAVVVGKHVDGKLVLTVEPPTDKERGEGLLQRVVNALTLAEPEGIRTTTELAKAVGCKKNALTAPLLKLAADGVIEKVADGAADVYRIAREDTPF